MTFVQWNSSLIVGHEIIDNQHKTLVYMLNALHKAISDGAERSRILRIFRQFFRYLIFHFNEEEYCTALIDLNMWQSNRREHIKFMESLTIIMNRVCSGEIDINIETVQLISDSYIEHISISDRSVVDHLNKHMRCKLKNSDALQTIHFV